MIKFDTGKWISSHPGKYNLSQSGMGGRINLEKYFKSGSMEDESVLKETIASLHNEDPENLVITHGATEALFLSLYHLNVNGHRDYVTYIPEYEPLIKDPPALGMREKDGDVFVFSNTNNPTGTEIEYPKNYRVYVVDDTFLQFYRNLDSVRYPENTYRINTFTKLYGGDEVRVGWIVAPDKKEAAEINSLKGIFTEQVSRHNIHIANSILKDQDEILKFVRNEMSKNITYIKNNMGKLKFYRNLEPVTGTVTFMDYSSYIEQDSVSVSEYLYKNQISIVPGTIFGVEGPYLRVCYTREDFMNSFELFKDALNSIS
ncbi:MAG: pyridoxal phosphate-dependent aminotransferase [Thermoplasmata archaeon]